MEDKEFTGNFIKKFDKCPVCGSKKRFFGDLLKRLQEEGLIDKKHECFFFQIHEGILLPANKLNLLPIGTKIPAFLRIWDTCSECGADYSIQVGETIATKSLEIPQMGSPMNRAERRHPGNSGKILLS